MLPPHRTPPPSPRLHTLALLDPSPTLTRLLHPDCTLVTLVLAKFEQTLPVVVADAAVDSVLAVDEAEELVAVVRSLFLRMQPQLAGCCPAAHFWVGTQGRRLMPCISARFLFMQAADAVVDSRLAVVLVEDAAVLAAADVVRARLRVSYRALADLDVATPGGGRGGAPRGGGRGGAGGRGGRGGARGGKGGVGAKGGAKVILEPHRHPGVFVAKGKEHLLVTRNLVPGESVYGEKRISIEQPNADPNLPAEKVEYRVWNPFRSKLAAGILGGLDDIHIGPGKKVLYLGAASGTSVSHVADVVGPVSLRDLARCLALL